MSKKPKKKTTKSSLETVDVHVTRDELEEEEKLKEDEESEEYSFEKVLNEVLDSLFDEKDDD
jgi:hypothetical protein